MQKLTAASTIALLCLPATAMAQTVLWGEPAPAQQQPVYPAPQPAPQYQLDPPQTVPLYYDTLQRQPVQPAPQYQPTQPQQPYFVPQRTEPAYLPSQPAQSPQGFPAQRIDPQGIDAQGIDAQGVDPQGEYRVIAPQVAPSPPQAQPEPSFPFEENGSATTGFVSERPDLVRTFASELDELVKLAERYRAASPGFLEDLRELADRYSTIEIVAPEPPIPATESPEPEMADTIDPDRVATEDEPPEVEDEIAMLEGDAPDAETVPMVEQAAEPEPAMAQPEPPQIEDAPTAVPQGLPPTTASVVYLRDDFSDGNFIAEPGWTVREGEWRIDQTYGLRPRSTRAEPTTPITPKDLLQYLLGDERPEGDAPRADSSAYLIEAETPIGNAFSLVANITDHRGEGAAHFILHQGGANWLGYRLELRAGPRPLVVLARRGASGYKDIMKVEAPGLTTGEPHQLRWARLSDGQMFVLIDGEPIITARDTVFQQGWTGFGFFVAGGDVSMRNIRIAEPVEQ